MSTTYPELIVNTDGGARGNPGPSAIGVVISTPDGTVVESFGRYIGETTNNQAEYQGVLAGVEAVAKYQPTTVKFVADSELVVKQLNGIYKLKNADLRPLFEQIKAVTAGKDVSFNHVRREFNQLADAEVNKTLDAR